MSWTDERVQIFFLWMFFNLVTHTNIYCTICSKIFLFTTLLIIEIFHTFWGQLVWIETKRAGLFRDNMQNRIAVTCGRYFIFPCGWLNPPVLASQRGDWNGTRWSNVVCDLSMHVKKIIRGPVGAHHLSLNLRSQRFEIRTRSSKLVERSSPTISRRQKNRARLTDAKPYDILYNAKRRRSGARIKGERGRHSVYGQISGWLNRTTPRISCFADWPEFLPVRSLWHTYFFSSKTSAIPNVRLISGWLTFADWFILLSWVR